MTKGLDRVRKPKNQNVLFILFTWPIGSLVYFSLFSILVLNTILGSLGNLVSKMYMVGLFIYSGAENYVTAFFRNTSLTNLLLGLFTWKGLHMFMILLYL